ncbi:hypothetical protein INR49_013838 [Caranx melampygus]|nr:hypothetical protein INR49_013838 [Caranx melampygus]
MYTSRCSANQRGELLPAARSLLLLLLLLLPQCFSGIKFSAQMPHECNPAPLALQWSTWLRPSDRNHATRDGYGLPSQRVPLTPPP